MLLAAPERWKALWENHSARICQAAGLVLLVIAKPRSNALFHLGFSLALAGEALRVWAVGQARKPEAPVEQGPYALTRSPLLFGSFVMALGLAVICTSLRHWLSTGLVWAGAWAAYRWPIEERIAAGENALKEKFGAEFESYRRHVPRFWPRWGSWEEALHTSRWELARAMETKEQKTLWALFGLALWLRFKMVYRF